MKHLNAMFNCLFCIVLYIVALVALTGVISNCILAGLLLFPLMFFVVGYFLKSNKNKQLRPKKNLWPVLQAISVLVMIYMAFVLEVSYSWDWGQMIQTAYKCAIGEENPYPDYYARYPNNRFWLTVLIMLFRGICFLAKGATLNLCKKVSMIFSVILVQSTVYMTYKISKRIFGTQKGFIVGCATILYLPLYLYSQFAYTDTPAMLLIVCLIYLYINFKSCKNKNRLLIIAALMGIVSALIYQIKIMGLIVMIAIIIDMVLSLNSFSKVKKYLACFLVFVLIFVFSIGIINNITDKNVPISEELSYQYEFPFTHWIMMGLGKSGGYDSADVAYTMSFDTYEKKFDANVSEIIKRISDRGLAGTLEHLFSTKISRTWGNSCLGGEDYVNRGTLNTDSLAYNLFALDGNAPLARKVYSGLCHSVLVIGILLTAFLFVRYKRADKLLFIRIAIFGVVLFLTIWECNSRYLLIVSPMLIICSFDGWFRTIKYLKEKYALRR